MMQKKERLEADFSQLRLELQRMQQGYGPCCLHAPRELRQMMAQLHDEIETLDERISPLARASGGLLNPNWGLLMRTGIDKSHMARQIERYADIYTSRVSNFLHLTPFAFLRSRRGSLPHDLSEETV